MKTIGIEIKGSEVRMVVLESLEDGYEITAETNKYLLSDHRDNDQVLQFKNQLHTAFDSIGPYRIAFVIRHDKSVSGQRSPSPVGFKLEGLIQLYEGVAVEGFWPITLSSHLKKAHLPLKAKYKYQEKALELAWYLMA